MEKNSVKSLLIIPYSPMTCRYYLNNSNDAHATTYDKVTEMLSSLAPWSSMRVAHLMERKLSFYVNIEEKTIQEVRPDEEKVLEQARNDKLDMSQSAITQFLKNKVDNMPISQVLYNELTNKLWRRNEKK